MYFELFGNFQENYLSLLLLLGFLSLMLLPEQSCGTLACSSQLSEFIHLLLSNMLVSCPQSLQSFLLSDNSVGFCCCFYQF